MSLLGRVWETEDVAENEAMSEEGQVSEDAVNEESDAVETVVPEE